MIIKTVGELRALILNVPDDRLIKPVLGPDLDGAMTDAMVWAKEGQEELFAETHPDHLLIGVDVQCLQDGERDDDDEELDEELDEEDQSE